MNMQNISSAGSGIKRAGTPLDASDNKRRRYDQHSATDAADDSSQPAVNAPPQAGWQQRLSEYLNGFRYRSLMEITTNKRLIGLLEAIAKDRCDEWAEYWDRKRPDTESGNAISEIVADLMRGREYQMATRIFNASGQKHLCLFLPEDGWDPDAPALLESAVLELRARSIKLESAMPDCIMKALCVMLESGSVVELHIAARIARPDMLHKAISNSRLNAATLEIGNDKTGADAVLDALKRCASLERLVVRSSTSLLGAEKRLIELLRATTAVKLTLYCESSIDCPLEVGNAAALQQVVRCVATASRIHTFELWCGFRDYQGLHDHILRPFEANSQLIKLSVVNNLFFYDGEPVDINKHALSGILALSRTCPNLRHFHFRQIDDATYIASFPFDTPELTAELERLESLAANCTLNCLSLTNMELYEPFVTTFFKGLAHNQHIEVLELKDCTFSLHALHALSRSLKTNDAIVAFKGGDYYHVDHQQRLHFVAETFSGQAAGTAGLLLDTDGEALESDANVLSHFARTWNGEALAPLETIRAKVANNSARVQRALRSGVADFMSAAFNAVPHVDPAMSHQGVALQDASLHLMAQLAWQGQVRDMVRLSEVKSSIYQAQHALAPGDRSPRRDLNLFRRIIRKEAGQIRTALATAYSSASADGMTAIKEGEVRWFELLTAKRDFPVNLAAANGSNIWLVLAVEAQSPAMVRSLVENGAIDFGGAAERAADRLMLPQIKQLLQAHNAGSTVAADALAAIRNNDEAGLQQAIAAGFYVNAANANNENIALLAAVESQNPAQVQLLHRCGAIDLNLAVQEAARRIDEAQGRPPSAVTTMLHQLNVRIRAAM